MPKIAQPLSATRVREAKTLGKSVSLYDGAGLYLQVTPSGSKLWRLRFKLNGRVRLMSLGKYPQVSLARAREQRFTLRKLISQGIDPIQQKKAEEATKADNTFKHVATDWHSQRKSEWSDKYSARVLRRLEIDVFPAFGDFPVADVRRIDVVRLLDNMQDRGVTETAYRAARDIEAIFDFALIRELVPGNPAARLSTRKSAVIRKRKTRHFAAITDRKKLGGLLRAIDGYQGDRRGMTKIGLNLLALTMVRPGELRHATWSEFQLREKTWEIPGTRMKMDRDHIVPLADQTVLLLEDLKRCSEGQDLILPSIRHHKRPISDNTFNAALRRLDYGKEDMTAHGFRATGSTLLNEEGWNRDWIERQLAHVEQSGSRKPYNRAEYLDGRREMMQSWADLLDDLREVATLQ